MKDGQGLSAAWVPIPICRIRVVKAAISTSLGTKSRRETYFHKNSPFEWAELFWGRPLAAQLSFLQYESLRSNDACAASPQAAACNEGGHTHIQGRTASGDSSGGANISRPGLRSGESSGVRSNARVRESQTTKHSVNARVVSPRSFGCAAGFCMFQVWEETAASTLPTTHPKSVAEFFLHIGNVVMRRQNTSHTGVQMVKPVVGDLRVARSSILVTCCQAPLERSVLFSHLSRVRSVSRESCPWSCCALSRLFRGEEKSMSSLSSS